MDTLTIPPLAVADDRVDNTALREAFEASGLSAGLVAHRLGWEYVRRQRRNNGEPIMRADATRLKRALGIVSERGRDTDPWRHRRTITLTVATAIAEAIGVDPVAVGL